MNRRKIQQHIELRPVDSKFEQYDKAPESSKYRTLQYVLSIVLLFGLLTLCWSLPFPYLKFLGKYNGYVNWASFLIAFLVYYYLKLSPMVSYAMLFLVFSFSYGIIQLEQWQKSGGPTLSSVGSAIFLIAIVSLLFIHFINSGNTQKGRTLKMLTLTPLWVIVSLFRKVKLRY